MQEGGESTFVAHSRCEACGSKDNCAMYSDGHSFCFGCSAYTNGEGVNDGERGGRRAVELLSGLISGELKALTKRGITEDTCAKFGYTVGVYNCSPVHIAPFHDDAGAVVAQHIRFPNKDFVWLGDSKRATLWGQHLWRDGGKQVVITEGEIDAMSISQLWGNKWPVVSLKSGAQGGKRDLGKACEWLEKFEHVILAFDMDDAGKKAAEECADQLTPGRVKVWNIPLKDANEMLVAGREKELIDAIWAAKVHRPDGIVSAADTWDILIQEMEHDNIPYPWAGLNEKTQGCRLGEIVTLTAGSGVGKSAVCREITSHLIHSGEKIGYIALEESVQRSVRGIVALELDKPLHLPAVRLAIPHEELKAAWERIKDSAYFYDHWGSTASDNLLNRIRYMARGCGCRWIVLDHISIVVSGDGDGDERRKIDNLMTSLRCLVEELKIGMFLVSHLKRPEGKGHEEGAATSLSQIRGSAGIAQLSDMVIGFERDQQDALEANVMQVRVLKNRYSGETGLACALRYTKETGR